ncbi:hypothetical protein [Pseudothauera rhizosphaerae]|uniref:hypothetical protein n=1 Tax=Pseudothauera rhizosphaerae TaxID=2565932 RepID=UPI001454D103|nr:hypothetical protein [Pseudothauera rhizosphaerae]
MKIIVTLPLMIRNARVSKTGEHELRSCSREPPHAPMEVAPEILLDKEARFTIDPALDDVQRIS